MNTQNDTIASVDKLHQLVASGLVAFKEAGKLYCKMKAANPAIGRVIYGKYPEFTPSVLRDLERIGQDTLLPDLIWRGGPGWTRLKEAPVALQRKMLKDARVSLFGFDGKVTVKPVDNLSLFETNRVFTSPVSGPVRVRTTAEQKRDAKPAPEKADWVVERGIAYIRRGVALNLSQARKMVAEMERTSLAAKAVTKGK